MLIIGLTGGIGSGKTTVANQFASYGVPIIDADVIARDITLPNTFAFNEIIKHFGQHLLTQHGTLDRSALRQIIFNQPQERIWLENLLHPIIRDQIEQQIAQILAPYCIIIIPLLFEVESYPFINRILVVDSPPNMQIERVIQRDKTDQTQVEAIIKTQVSREFRLKGAQDIIVNDGSVTDLHQQVEKLHLFYNKISLQ